MAEGRATLERLATWWDALSADDKALVERHTSVPSDSEDLREVVALSGLAMVPCFEWSAHTPLYDLPSQIQEYVKDRAPILG
jgi:hypothetical protein